MVSASYTPEGDQFQSATGKHLGQYGEVEIKVSRGCLRELRR